MKINPIGINTYQQIARTGRTGHPASLNNAEISKLKVSPQSASGPSKVSVKPRIINTSTIMTPSELNALGNLVKIINAKSAGNAGYSGNLRSEESSELIGHLVDVKV